MMTLKKPRLGEMLTQSGLISPTQLDLALAEHQRTGRKLGQTLVELGMITEAVMLQCLANQLDLPLINLRHYKIDPDVVLLLPEVKARRYKAMPLSKNEGEIVVAMADPTDLMAFDDISRALKLPVKPGLVRESELLQLMDQYYRQTEHIAHLAGQIGEEMAQNKFDLTAMAGSADIADAPVVRLLESLFDDAVHRRASDIHIEPDEGLLRIRQRIDGVLSEHIILEQRVAAALVSRLKLMSGLNISERRIPQDGRFTVFIRQHHIDVRLSTMPVQQGESVVMRLLDHSQGMLNLGQIGMTEQMLTRFRKIIHLPYGMVLVTGPTGCGKTTTLYAALSELNAREKKIITAEDPVEYTLPRINQVQVHPDIGLTFATVLRAALRQDPDIILVGEMRDQETAEIALRSALTGHLVLSTLHTNNAIASVSRLLDMRAEGFLVAAVLRAIVAQRLVRRNCDACTTVFELEDRERIALESALGVCTQNLVFQRGEGCQRCNNTGYRGRIGVYEMLETDRAMLDAIRRGDITAFAEIAEQSDLFRPFTLCALDYAKQGITTPSEVIRIAGETA